jgi:RNA polymerase sigma-70 factor (ECF subfamily)
MYHLNLPQNSGFDSPEGYYSIGEINTTLNHSQMNTGFLFPCIYRDIKYEEIAETMHLQ